MKITTSAAAPDFVPESVGDHHHDTEADIWYIADGVVSAGDWKALPVSAPPIADFITNGVTDVAPSQNAVYDALALKQNAALTVGNGAHWADPNPTTIQAAIDRLAAAVSGLLAGEIP